MGEVGTPRHPPAGDGDVLAVAPLPLRIDTERHTEAHHEPAAPAASRRRATRALLEVIDRDGHVRQVWTVQGWPARIGRALDNDVVLTDPHVAPHHFTLTQDEHGELALEVGDTVNGVAIGPHRIGTGARSPLPRDAASVDLVAGRSRLRLRLAEAPVAAEVPLAGIAVHDLRILPSLGIGLVLLAGIAFSSYLDSDPDTFSRLVGQALLAALSATAVWCGAWALLSKTFTRQSHFGWHVRVFVAASLVLLALSVLPPLVAFAFSWPWVTDYSFVAVYATAAAAVYFHLLAVEPARRRLMRGIAAAGFVVGVALALWFNVQRTGRPGEELYMNHLFPPQLRLAKPNSVDAFVSGLAPMQAILDKTAKEQSSGAGDARGGDDEE